MEIQCPQCPQRLRYADSLINPLLRCPHCSHVFRVEPTRGVTPDAISRPAITREFTPLPSRGAPAAAAVELSPLATPQRARNATGDFVRSAPPTGTRPSSDTYRTEPVRSPSLTFPTTRAPRSTPWGSIGWTVMVVVLLAFKAGPRLFKHFAKERQVPNQPVELNDEQRQAVERIFHDVEQQLAKERAAREAAGENRPLFPGKAPPRQP